MNAVGVQPKREVVLPRGDKRLGENLVLDMYFLDYAESRLPEVRISNGTTSKELEALFNEAANLATKYLAWISYEMLHMEKTFSLDKAEVIIDKMPAEAARLKEAGIKMNEDYRDALIARDEKCSATLDKINTLKAYTAILEAATKSFVRAHYSARENAENKSNAPLQNMTTTIDSTSAQGTNLMGSNNIGTRRF